MKQLSGEEIRKAEKPSQIFTMDLNVIEEEHEEYLKRFKKAESHKEIENYVILKKVELLYRKAKEELSKAKIGEFNLRFCSETKSGEQFDIICEDMSESKMGKMYSSEEYVIFQILEKYKKYYENYIQKTAFYPKIDRKMWSISQYMFPNVFQHFQSIEGDFIIIVKKPCTMYSLRSLLEYFDGKLAPEYVASIVSRLQYWMCYMDLLGMYHNGITVDNLFFAPGRFLEEEEMENATVEDQRIVGVFGGWFFTTYSREKITGLPKEIYQIMPKEARRGFSSYKVDAAAIKQVARELLGGEMEDIPKPFKEWLSCKENTCTAYEEYHNWNKVKRASFGKDRFVPMHINNK